MKGSGTVAEAKRVEPVVKFDFYIACVAGGGGKFHEATLISGGMLNEFKRKDWGEEKNWRGGGGGGKTACQKTSIFE